MWLRRKIMQFCKMTKKKILPYSDPLRTWWRQSLVVELDVQSQPLVMGGRILWTLTVLLSILGYGTLMIHGADFVCTVHMAGELYVLQHHPFCCFWFWCPHYLLSFRWVHIPRVSGVRPRPPDQVNTMRIWSIFLSLDNSLFINYNGWLVAWIGHPISIHSTSFTNWGGPA